MYQKIIIHFKILEPLRMKNVPINNMKYCVMCLFCYYEGKCKKSYQKQLMVD